jgi:hypothetical protein
MAVATKDEVANITIGGRKLRGSEFVLKAEDILIQNVESALLRLGYNLADKLEANAPMDSGGLKKSFGSPSIIQTKTGYRVEIPVSVDYADYIDKGVKGIKNKRKTYKNEEGRLYQFKTYYMPAAALKQLEGWMKRKNMEIEATNLIEGRSMLPQISSSAKRLAYYIKKYGIEGRQFIKKSIDEATPEFNVDIKTIGTDSLILRISK